MAKPGSIQTGLQKPVLEMDVQSMDDAAFQINYEIVTEAEGYFNTPEIHSLRQKYQNDQTKMEALIKERQRLTNQADLLDYEIAAACGLLCGTIDILFIGELDLKKAHEWGNDKITKFVLFVAKHTKGTGKDRQPYKGNDIQGAIRHLEKNFGAPSDRAAAQFGGGASHHLRDFAHHPNLMGLMFSLLTQFTMKAYGTDTAGHFIIVDIPKTDGQTFIGHTLSEKFLFGVIYWFFHMVSDMAGSNSHAGGGTGLPGPMLSLAKRLSACPIFTDKDGINTFSLWISKAFNGTLTARRDGNGRLIKETVQRIDLRTELGILRQQAFPVLLNEVLVRGFYFISRIQQELDEKNIHYLSELNQLDWGRCIPLRNRTIVRMITISSSTFTAVDLADAAIRAAAKSGGNAGAFAGQLLLRINFAGVGRTVLAISTDLGMEWERGKVQEEINCVLVKELHSYTDLLRAERIELKSIVCWGIALQLQEVNAITMALEEHNTNAAELLTNQYLEKHKLNTQFGNFDEFQHFMLDTDEDLIL